MSNRGARWPVPEHLRDASYRGAKRLGHGEGYQYAHDHPGHFVAQDYLGADKRYYEPTEQGVEKKIKERVEKWRAQFAKSAARSPKAGVVNLRHQRSWLASRCKTQFEKRSGRCATRFAPS